jgi:hypothetical protein
MNQYSATSVFYDGVTCNHKWLGKDGRWTAKHDERALFGSAKAAELAAWQAPVHGKIMAWPEGI